MTRSLVWAALWLVVALGGCSQSGLDVVSVHGKITFGGGEWPDAASAYFTPVDAPGDEPRIPAQATLAKDGAFTVQSTAGEGLVPGTYRVAVQCWKQPPDEQNQQGVSHVPEKYRSPDTSGLEVKVEAGKSEVVVALDVPKS